MIEKTPEILFTDTSLLVVSKPAGLLSIPDGYDRRLPYLGSLLAPVYGRLWVVHRLDKETSGVMVFARTAEDHSSLNAQFTDRQVAKTYHALLAGSPDWVEKALDVPLRVGVGRRKRSVVDHARGKPSLTRFCVLERYPGHALLEARPETGRTHQIRAHLYHLGFGILGDPLYGAGEPSPLIPRLALHARSLAFRHPTSGEPRSFLAPYPQDFERALSHLREAR